MSVIWRRNDKSDVRSRLLIKVNGRLLDSLPQKIHIEEKTTAWISSASPGGRRTNAPVVRFDTGEAGCVHHTPTLLGPRLEGQLLESAVDILVEAEHAPVLLQSERGARMPQASVRALRRDLNLVQLVASVGTQQQIDSHFIQEEEGG